MFVALVAVVAVVAVVAFPVKAPTKVVAVKVPELGLYDKGFVVLSTFKGRLPALLDTKTG